jgi:hypothetical protein
MSKAEVTGILLAVLVATAIMDRSHDTVRFSSPNDEASTNREGSTQSKQAEASPNLAEVAQKFTAVIRSGSPLELLDYWSDDGVTFGVDADPVSKEQFRKQVERKASLFCFFFDSDCFRKQINDARRRANKGGGAGVLYSYRDLLTKAKSVTPKVSQRKDGDGPVGDLKIRIENGDSLKGNEQTALEFAFAFEKGNWKLTSVIYN